MIWRLDHISVTRLYRWDFKYKKDDIKDLTEDMYQHRDWMDDA
jgi:hypothetical protein